MLAEGQETPGHIGLTNVHSRLKLNYDSGSGIGFVHWKAVTAASVCVWDWNEFSDTLLEEGIWGLRAVVVDDELLTVEALTKLIPLCCPEIEVVGDAGNGEEALG